MVRGDAFTYQPPAAVDWLLCDIICEPARTLALVERWMAQGWCRRLVATLKFKGQSGYPILPEARRRLAALGWAHIRLKHLSHHHNEVALLASRE
jgi:23S rRNA (cytidine2498-2'-O)-methyltransferase